MFTHENHVMTYQDNVTIVNTPQAVKMSLCKVLHGKVFSSFCDFHEFHYHQ